MPGRRGALILLAASLVAVSSCRASADEALSPAITSTVTSEPGATPPPARRADPATTATSPTTTRRAATTTAVAATTSTTTNTTASTTSSTTTSTTSTVPATSSTVVLPTPAPPPVEDGTLEPYFEVGRIAIPRLGLDRPLLEGVRLATLDHGPGHWPGTALPGQVGNVVVAGHRVSHHADFRHLDDLVAGDDVVFTVPWGQWTYVVESVEIVGPDALWIVDQTAEHRATLFACHPPGSVAERIVVHLRLAA